MPNRTADSSNDFEWPPREDVLATQVFKLGDPLPPPASSPAAAPAADPAIPSQDLLEEPHVVLRRVLEARADAKPAPGPGPPRQPPSPVRVPWKSPFSAARRDRLRVWMRKRLVPFAVAALAIVVVLQTVYILRVGRQPVVPAPANSTATVVPPAVTPETDVQPAPRSRPAPRTRTEPLAGTAAAGTSGSAPRRAAAGARLVIRSDPPGAQVSIDGRSRGVTPLTLTGVKPGEYRLTLERAGVQVQQTVRVVDAEGTISVLAPMLPAGPVSGWLTVQSPIVLDVYEDGSLLGTSRSRRVLLPAGPHSLQFVNEQLEFRETRDVQVEPGEVAQVSIELPQASVLVNATPWAEVYVDGKHVGQTPIGRLSLPIGTYEVVFQHPELGERRMSAVVKAGAPTRITMDLRRP